MENIFKKKKEDFTDFHMQKDAQFKVHIKARLV